MAKLSPELRARALEQMKPVAIDFQRHAATVSALAREWRLLDERMATLFQIDAECLYEHARAWA